jgi:hypothetical protein
MNLRLRGLGAGVAVALLLGIAPRADAAADFSGVWTVVGGGGGGSDAFDKNPESEWTTEKLPFTRAGRAAFDANHPGKGPRLLKNPQQRNDPLTLGNPPGLYRTLVYSRPMEFVQTPGRLVQIFEWSRVWRPIYLDGRPVPKEITAGPYWYGHSVGRWEGDTLVVNTMALDSRAWLDEWGTPFTDDAQVVERWRRTAPDMLELQITVTDPEMYTKPWTSMPIKMKLQKKSVELTEIIHAPVDEALFDKLVAHPAGGPEKPAAEKAK